MISSPLHENERLARAAGAERHFRQQADDFVAQLRREMSVPHEADHDVESEFAKFRQELDRLCSPFSQRFGELLSSQLVDAHDIRLFLEGDAMQNYIAKSESIECELQKHELHWAAQLRDLVACQCATGAVRPRDPKAVRAASKVEAQPGGSHVSAT